MNVYPLSNHFCPVFVCLWPYSCTCFVNCACFVRFYYSGHSWYTAISQSPTITTANISWLPSTKTSASGLGMVDQTCLQPMLYWVSTYRSAYTPNCIAKHLHTNSYVYGCLFRQISYHYTYLEELKSQCSISKTSKH